MSGPYTGGVFIDFETFYGPSLKYKTVKRLRYVLAVFGQNHLKRSSPVTCLLSIMSNRYRQQVIFNSTQKSCLSIALLLSKGFFKMLLVSILIGAPVSFFINNLWLQKFPNRVEFGIGTLLSGTVILMVLGLLTIGSQTIRASKNNPVDCLKYD